MQNKAIQKIIIAFAAVIFFLFLLHMSTTHFNLPKTFYKARDDSSFIYNYPKRQLSTSDYKRLINITNFQFKILNECNSNPFLLVLVHTSPKHRGRRNSIRQTWGSKRNDLKVIFALGSVQNATVQKQLEEENEEYKDFIQGSYLDAYKNLTYKHVMLFKYVIYHCPQAKYILKTDDDTFVNMPTMMYFLTNLSPYGTRNFLFCTVWTGMPVLRDPKNKWYVSVDEFKDPFYPKYCSGYAMLYSPDVLFELYEVAQKSEYFWVDDAFVTGMCAKNKSIIYMDVSSLLLNYKDLEKISKHSVSPGWKPFLYGPLNVPIDKMYLLWKFVTNQISDSVGTKIQ